MSVSTCQLGDYGIELIKNGRKLNTANAKIGRIEWSRVLDASSTAKIDLITAGANCCGEIGAVDHWNTDLVIYSTNPSNGDAEVVWRGPVVKPTFRRGSVTVEAADVLKWMQVRSVEQDFDFVSQDVVEIFETLLQYAMQKDPTNVPDFNLLKYDTGVVESRKVEGSALRWAWNIVQEMLDTGLDVTTFGSTVIAGIPAFTTLELKDTDVIGSVEVVKDGEDFVSRAIANASRDIVGIWPDGPARGINGYPLVEGLVQDTQLQDLASAVAAAKAKQQFSANGVRRVRANGGLVLLPSSKINPKTLIAGQLFNFQATETCYGATETLRLGRLNVVVTKKQQTATIELQPTGELQSGDTL